MRPAACSAPKHLSCSFSILEEVLEGGVTYNESCVDSESSAGDQLKKEPGIWNALARLPPFSQRPSPRDLNSRKIERDRYSCEGGVRTCADDVW